MIFTLSSLAPSCTNLILRAYLSPFAWCLLKIIIFIITLQDSVMNFINPILVLQPLKQLLSMKVPDCGTRLILIYKISVVFRSLSASTKIWCWIIICIMIIFFYPNSYVHRVTLVTVDESRRLAFSLQQKFFVYLKGKSLSLTFKGLDT